MTNADISSTYCALSVSNNFEIPLHVSNKVVDQTQTIHAYALKSTQEIKETEVQ